MIRNCNCCWFLHSCWVLLVELIRPQDFEFSTHFLMASPFEFLRSDMIASLYSRVICTLVVCLYFPPSFITTLPPQSFCAKPEAAWFIFYTKSANTLCKCMLYWLHIAWTNFHASFFYRFFLDLHAVPELSVEQSACSHLFRSSVSLLLQYILGLRNISLP